MPVPYEVFGERAMAREITQAVAPAVGGRCTRAGADRALAFSGIVALCVQISIGMTGDRFEQAPDKPAAAPDGTVQAAPGATVGRAMSTSDIAVGGYGGVSYTHPSTVVITKPGVTDMSVRDFSWIGKPFNAPIYYGVRVQKWQPFTGVGSMIDFTHAKAIAVADDQATFTGTRDGKPVAQKARVSDVFRHLEFSHGHNLLMLNGLFRWPSLGRLSGPLRPYVGIGAGITLPHTEVGFADQNTRTYEYQFAGFVGQVLGGFEIDLGRTSVFAEYKFSYSPYEVPLSEEPRGFVLFTDLWRQFRAWVGGDAPTGGRLATPLATHHAISGVMVKVGRAAATAGP
jgi:lipid A oxidase